MDERDDEHALLERGLRRLVARRESMETALYVGVALTLIGALIATFAPWGRAVAAAGALFAIAFWLRFALARCPRCGRRVVGLGSILLLDGLGATRCRHCKLRFR
jgi:hypothetical protein